MMGTALRILCLLLSVVAASANPTETTKVLGIGSRLELFVDDYLIESMEGVRLKLHEPRSEGKILEFSLPWEGVTSIGISVLKDDDGFKLYYLGRSRPDFTRQSALKPGEKVIPEHEVVVCLAESPDGRTWSKPTLNLVEYDGSRENNIVALKGGVPFLDTNPDVPRSERFKSPRIQHEEGVFQLEMSVSPDGKHWTTWPQAVASWRDIRGFDSPNLMFWSKVEQQYVFYYRLNVDYRTIARSTAPRLDSWPDDDVTRLRFRDSPPQHLYTNAATPYFRAPHIYVAFPKRHHPWRTRYLDSPHPGLSESVFMASRNGVDWTRYLDAFIPPGRDERNWVHRANLMLVGVHPTASDEISLYINRHYTFPTAYIERLTLRSDGFVSLRADYQGGEVITKPFIYEGEKLILNFSTSAFGSIQVEVQDPSGNPFPGLTLAESPLIFGDEVAYPVTWQRKEGEGRWPGKGPALKRHSGRPVRLRFVMKDADLYSLRFK